MESKQLYIIHIEDNDEHAELVSAAIAESKLASQVIHFVDAETCLEYLSTRGQEFNSIQSSLPDLILLDLSLPKMSGLEFLLRLRANPLTGGIPVVVLTNSDDPTQIDRLYRSGANSYIVKPMKYEDFIIKIAELNMYWFGTSEMPNRNKEKVLVK